MSFIGYGRVSTAECRQVLDRQLEALNAAGFERVFKNHVSGAASEHLNLTARRGYLPKAMSSSTWTSVDWDAAPATSLARSTSSINAASGSARSIHSRTPPHATRNADDD